MTHQGIIPPYLLDTVATRCDGEVAARAAFTRQIEQTLRARREVKTTPPTWPERSRDGGADGPRGENQGGPSIVPPHLRSRVNPRAAAPKPRRETAADSESAVPSPSTTPATPQRSVHDARHGSSLPGELERAEGDAAVSDESVNEAYDGLGATWRLLYEVYGRDSLDGRGLPLVATVHYERGYDNAFWNGEQMVFGDGDGEIFASFTDSVDVIGHELAHGLTQYTSGLIYLAQAGALNESISDVFGVLTTQYTAGQSADEADWLIGAQLFRPGVKGVALRSMKAPGTAYDDPRLGADPQPAHMRDYQDLSHDDSGDNGGVHINSGIPNHAFYLFANALGGKAWERAGQVWYDTIMQQRLPKDAQFATFAAATRTAAETRYGRGDVVDALTAAWAGVGVDGQGWP